MNAARDDATLVIPRGKVLPREVWDDLRANHVRAYENEYGDSVIVLSVGALRDIERKYGHTMSGARAIVPIADTDTDTAARAA